MDVLLRNKLIFLTSPLRTQSGFENKLQIEVVHITFNYFRISSKHRVTYHLTQYTLTSKSMFNKTVEIKWLFRRCYMSEQLAQAH
jgi:hypothetical protein